MKNFLKQAALMTATLSSTGAALAFVDANKLNHFSKKELGTAKVTADEVALLIYKIAHVNNIDINTIDQNDLQRMGIMKKWLAWRLLSRKALREETTTWLNYIKLLSKLPGSFTPEKAVIAIKAMKACGGLASVKEQLSKHKIDTNTALEAGLDLLTVTKQVTQ